MALLQSKLSASARASQDIVPIVEIRDGVVVLKDGSLRAVLMASTINFALKSTEEQDAIIAQYQNFLNSLDFSIEFTIQSRKLNIEPYLDTLREIKKTETNELMRIQITEYVNFVKEFVENSKIVSKAFYVIVPFIPFLNMTGQKNGIRGMLKSIMPGKAEDQSALDDAKFEEHKTQLFQRVDTVVQGLVRTGVRMAPLNTEELIELYYGLYNPGEVEGSGAPEFRKNQEEK